MLYIIDGTGPSNDYEYEKSMAGGFCKQLQIKTGTPHYLRGPTALGITTLDIAKTMLRRINDVQCSKPESIYLAGYSRGGAAIIYIAQQLKSQGQEVSAMFLYDAVDRALFNFNDLQTIPSTVKRCYHAMRDSSLATYYHDGARIAVQQYLAASHGFNVPGDRNVLREKARDLLEQDRKMRLVMRTGWCPSMKIKWEKVDDLLRAWKKDGLLELFRKKSADDFADIFSFDEFEVPFGNCGIKPMAAVISAKFVGSHGALGGAPIIDGRAPKLLREADRAAIASVDAWMSSKLISEGVLRGGRVLS